MTNWSKLALFKPRDRTAGVVTSQSSGPRPSGPRPAVNHSRWDTPPPLKRIARDQVDLTGRTFGFLRVVGFKARSASAIESPINIEDACRECRHHERLKQIDREAPVRPTKFYDDGGRRS